MIQKVLIVLFSLISSSFKYTESANWAQTSGYLDQNVVIPTIPSPAKKHWQARYGFSNLAFPNVIMISFFTSKTMFYSHVINTHFNLGIHSKWEHLLIRRRHI